MFWGLIVEPGKTYKQTVEKSFHVSMACLQPDKCKDTGYSSFILKTAGQEFVLCNLQKGSTNQVPLDLNFNAGDEIAFTTSGAKNTVHLSGYLITDEEDMDDEMFMDSDSEIDPADLKQLTKKRKNLLERVGSGKIPKLDEDGEDDDDEEEDDDDEEDSDNALAKLEAIEEDDEDSDDDEEEEEVEEVKVQPEPKVKGNKTPSTPVAQTNGNGPESGKKNKKNKDSLKKTPNANTPNAQNMPKTPAPVTPSKKTLEGGVIVEEIKVGVGAAARPGQNVKVYYTGRLKSTGKQFDSTTSGKPFAFRLGRGEVIKGWDIGVSGMQIGGKRKLTIPSALAYGAKGAPPSIPPNSVLVFDVELKGL